MEKARRSTRKFPPKADPPSAEKKRKPKKTTARKKPVSSRTASKKAPSSGRRRAAGPRLEKAEENPVLQPNPANAWETKAVFNPAALYEDGKVHLAYRAIGDDDRSALGYAESRDGLHFGERLSAPMYVATEPFEGSAHLRPRSSQGAYASGGGGWGGVEDPRMTRIDDRVYMTYVAYDGWSPPRVALTSIALKDFLEKKWNWKKPVLISRPDVVDKNACVFPEKVRGKYVILHRVFPDILLDYVDDLDFDGKSGWLKGQHAIKPDPESWDSRKIGAGAPPIKTKRGWLLIYQAVGDHDAGRYKMGAMLLDLRHPEVVRARSKEPILEPDEWYENQGWKSGVAYPCGAVVKDGRLLVYYGGADTFVCAAEAPLDEFVEQLIKTGAPKLKAAGNGSKRKGNASR